MVSLTKSFLTSAHKISRKCSNPDKVFDVMKHSMRKTLKLLQSQHAVDLLYHLKERKIGTMNMEKLCRTVCNGLPDKRRKTLVEIVMRWKCSDVMSCLRKEKYQNTKIQKECRKTNRRWKNLKCSGSKKNNVAVRS